jgi:hypothetical protein
MSKNDFLSEESTKWCAIVLRAFRRRFVLTLDDCVKGMDLPAGADATIARMEHAVNPWRYHRFDRFVSFAAPMLRMQPEVLRACLLGDGNMDAVADVTDWEYARLGSEAASQLLCRLECRWTPGSHWAIFFRTLPAFLLTEPAHEGLDYQIPGQCDDMMHELTQAFEGIYRRFFDSFESDRIRLTLVPLPGALSLLAERKGAYHRWDAGTLKEVVEVLCFDCIDERGTVFAQSLRSDHGDILQDIDWLLVSDDLAIRHREGARALDSIKILPTPSDSDCRTAKRIRSLIDPDSLQDITRVTRFSL